MAGGKHAYLSTGEGLSYFESRLESAFVSPLPDAADLDPTKVRFDREELKVGNAKLPCVMVVPLMASHGRVQEIPLGIFPTYCFDPILPALRVKYSFATITEGFDAIAKVQGRFLPKEVAFFDGRREILSAKMESVEGLSPSDPALTPDSHAKFPGIDKIQVSDAVALGFLIKKVTPIYPQDAKDAGVSGKVVLGAIIGRDGRIHDLRVIEAPWPSLVVSAMWAVSQWQYKPYLLYGEPVEVNTTIDVFYTLGR
jgi:TonB family protein